MCYNFSNLDPGDKHFLSNRTASENEPMSLFISLFLYINTYFVLYIHSIVGCVSYLETSLKRFGA